jgi:cell division protein FtsI/penicillin-binding protein 2
LRKRIESASGLHPAPIFVFFAFAFVAVAGAALRLCLLAPGEQPNTDRRSEGPTPAFSLHDRHGRPLARSVERNTLSVSPRALLRVHTPWRIAEGLAGLLDDIAVVGEGLWSARSGAVMARILPEGVAAGKDGWLLLREPFILRFNRQRAEALETWIKAGGGLMSQPLAGIAVEPIEDSSEFTLAWAPTQLLAESQRMAALGEGGAGHPERWTKHLLNGVAQALGLQDEDGYVVLSALPVDLARKLRPINPGDQALRLRDEIWAELMPAQHRVVAHGVDPVRAAQIKVWMGKESVYGWQLSLTPTLERSHTTSVHGDAKVPMGEPGPDGRGADPFGILGHYGTLGHREASAQAIRERGTRPWLLPLEGARDPLEARSDDLANRERPRSGLEYSVGELLSEELWRGRILSVPRTYKKRIRNVSRDRKGLWKGRVPGYFIEATPAVAPPAVWSTLDADLQQHLDRELVEVLGRTRAAMAMAIVLNVETCDVLAVGSRSPYPVSGYAPTQYSFTPGSILKPLVMAIALGVGVVRPDEMFRTFAPVGISLQLGSGSRRIREAKGAPQEDEISATSALAHSVNAVMVQIGRRIEARVFRQTLAACGLGRAPGAGIGPESSGFLAPLVKGTWNSIYTHASVSFGHELSVTLWQQAGALATIARGGEYRPLRLLREVRQGRNVWPIELEPGARVLSSDACDQVLAMLEVGAKEGTGRRVAGGGALADLSWYGSKTGTTEKEDGVPCSHQEADHQLRHKEDGTACSSACFRSLRGKRAPGHSCYTSSMCLMGRLTPDGPMVMVLVVVDERREGQRYGADVAGPSAVRLLRLGLGLDPVREKVQQAPVGRVLIADGSKVKSGSKR